MPTIRLILKFLAFQCLAVVTYGFSLTNDGKASARTVLVLGDSLAAGYGLDPEQAFPALLEKKARSSGFDVRVVNAGVSGDTTASGLRRISWLLRSPVDVLILELGANDGLRGVPVEETRRNLEGIIARTREKYPEVRIVIAGMRVPPNLGQEYSESFARLFVDLAKQQDAALVPFLLEGIAGRPHLNLPDGIHPTAEGQEILAENVWKVLARVLKALD